MTKFCMEKKEEAEIAPEHQKSFAWVEVDVCLAFPDSAAVWCWKHFLIVLIPE